jgi:AraC-like DNA-binding protein
MLHRSELFARDGLRIQDVRCGHGAGRGEPEVNSHGHGLVFVRRGCFVRSAQGDEILLDPTLAYALAPGWEQRYDHPHGEGDDCTALLFEPALLAGMCGGAPDLPTGPLPTSPALDLEHRHVLALARRGEDPHELFERALTLGAALLTQTDQQRVQSGRPATARLRRRLVDSVREALVVRPDTSLPELAAQLAVSPHHLSRVFRTATGETIAAHRIRLRARSVLERLADGERNLSRLATDVGFTDQGYMCRVLRRETGRTPSALRALLAALA